MATEIQVQLRRHLATDWTTNDPTLLSGEIGYETDTGKWKWGDGVTAWTSLSYDQFFGGDIVVTGDIAAEDSRFVWDTSLATLTLGDAASDTATTVLIEASATPRLEFGDAVGVTAYLEWNDGLQELGIYSDADISIRPGNVTALLFDDLTLQATFSGDVAFVTAAPRLLLEETGATANNTKWDVLLDAEQLQFRVLSDDELTHTDWMTVDRVLNVVTNLTLNATLTTIGAGDLEVSHAGSALLKATSTTDSFAQLRLISDGADSRRIMGVQRAAPFVDSQIILNDDEIVFAGRNSPADDMFVLTPTVATFTGMGVFPASTTSFASVRLPHGVAPTTPVDGDLWTTTAGAFVEINGTTVGPLIDSGGAPSTNPGGSDTQVQYNNGGSFGGIAEMTYNDVTGVLTFSDVVDIDNTAAGNRALDVYSNVATRTVPLVDIVNDNATGSGVAVRIQQDQGGAAIDLVSQGTIKFPATATPSTDANTLDDYQEGDHTVTVTMTTSGTITLTSTLDTLAYTKIGRQVTVTGRLAISSVSSPVGLAQWSLPFAQSSLTDGGDDNLYPSYINSMNTLADGIYLAFLAGAVGYFYLYDPADPGPTAIAVSELIADTSVWVNFTYFTDE